MSQTGTTKEERFIVAVLKKALELGGPRHSVDRYAVGTSIGLHARGIDTICNQLAQANFIKKQGERMIQLTPQGEELVNNI